MTIKSSEEDKSPIRFQLNKIKQALGILNHEVNTLDNFLWNLEKKDGN
tara:strand:+ start:3366 stop:3509 length:144 start_codon:yes stop_codon:yes gene_type:complete